MNQDWDRYKKHALMNKCGGVGPLFTLTGRKQRRSERARASMTAMIGWGSGEGSGEGGRERERQATERRIGTFLAGRQANGQSHITSAGEG